MKLLITSLCVGPAIALTLSIVSAKLSVTLPRSSPRLSKRGEGPPMQQIAAPMPVLPATRMSQELSNTLHKVVAAIRKGGRERVSALDVRDYPCGDRVAEPWG